MNAQTSLPGCAATPTVNRAALEQDLRGDTALAILAYLAWSDAHGGTKQLLDGSVAAWLTSGKPDDPQISRSLTKLRTQLARYVAQGGHVPGWFPPKLLEALGEPRCADEISAASMTAPPSEIATMAASQRCTSVAIRTENRTETTHERKTP
jgi:hypothetical protein